MEKDVSAHTIEELIGLLDDKDWTVRCNAIDALGKVGDVRAVDPLIRLLNDEKAGFRASYALSKIGEPAVERLIELLEDESFAARNGVIDALGEIGDIRAIEPLLELLGNKDRSLRSDASYALSKIGEPAVERLIELLTHEDSTIRIHAAYTLGTIGDDRAMEPLIHALWDIEETVPLCVSDALDKIDCNWTTREWARKHLCYLSEALMKGNIPVKFYVMDILERIGDPGVSEILTKALAIEEKNVQLRAAEALEKIKNKDL